MMRGWSSILVSIESDLIFRKRRARLDPNTIEGFAAQIDLSGFQIFADEKFNIGKAWFCEDTQTGGIYRISPEYAEDVEFVNSSMKSFVASAEALSAWFANLDSSALEVDLQSVESLVKQMKSVDQRAFASSRFMWPVLLDHIRVCIDDLEPDVEFAFVIT